MDDGLYGDTRNDLSGRAQSVAQVRTVNGGLHVYSWTPRRTSAVWLAVALSLVLVGGITVIAVSRGGRTELNSGQASRSWTGPPGYDLRGRIPTFDRSGRQQYWKAIPDWTEVFAFQVYRCGNAVYPTIAVGATRFPGAQDLGLLARGFTAEFVAVVWSDSTSVTIQAQAGDGLFGVEIIGRFAIPATPLCGAVEGKLRCRVTLDRAFYQAVIAVGTDGGPDDRLSDREVEEFLDDVVSPTG